MKRSNVTYGQVDKILRSLGFSCRLIKDDPPPTRVYQHKEAGAMIMLPAFPERQKVFEYHLASVRTELDNFGIADPTTFDSKLRKAG
jgi:hypothetical protein